METALSSVTFQVELSFTETFEAASVPDRADLPVQRLFPLRLTLDMPPSSTLTLPVSVAFPEAFTVTLLFSPSAVISPLKNALSPEKSAVMLLPSFAVMFPFILAPSPEKKRFMTPVFVPCVPVPSKLKPFSESGWLFAARTSPFCRDPSPT